MTLRFLRAVSEQDIDRIAAFLSQENYGGNKNISYIGTEELKYLADANLICTLQNRDKAIIGAIVVLILELYGEKIAFFVMFCVAKPFRQQGYGKLIIGCLCNILRGVGVERVYYISYLSRNICPYPQLPLTSQKILAWFRPFNIGKLRDVGYKFLPYPTSYTSLPLLLKRAEPDDYQSYLSISNLSEDGGKHMRKEEWSKFVTMFRTYLGDNICLALFTIYNSIDHTPIIASHLIYHVGNADLCLRGAIQIDENHTDVLYGHYTGAITSSHIGTVHGYTCCSPRYFTYIGADSFAPTQLPLL